MSSSVPHGRGWGGGEGVCQIMGILGLRGYLGPMRSKPLIEPSLLEFIYGYVTSVFQLSEQQRAPGGAGHTWVYRPRGTFGRRSGFT